MTFETMTVVSREKEGLYKQCKDIPKGTGVDIDINKLVEAYFTMNPWHQPYIYWKVFCHCNLETDELKMALKKHEMSKYVKWQSNPPVQKVSFNNTLLKYYKTNTSLSR